MENRYIKYSLQIDIQRSRYASVSTNSYNVNIPLVHRRDLQDDMTK